MNLKAILWMCGTTIAASGLVLGLRNVARAEGIDDNRPYNYLPHSRLDEQQTNRLAAADDPFSPDAFREELLK